MVKTLVVLYGIGKWKRPYELHKGGLKLFVSFGNE